MAGNDAALNRDAEYGFNLPLPSAVCNGRRSNLPVAECIEDREPFWACGGSDKKLKSRHEVAVEGRNLIKTPILQCPRMGVHDQLIDRKFNINFTEQPCGDTGLSAFGQQLVRLDLELHDCMTLRVRKGLGRPISQHSSRSATIDDPGIGIERLPQSLNWSIIRCNRQNFALVGVEDAHQRKKQNVFLRLRILIDQADAYSRLSRDIEHGRAVVALLGEQFDRGGDDLLATLFDQNSIRNLALDHGLVSSLSHRFVRSLHRSPLMTSRCSMIPCLI